MKRLALIVLASALAVAAAQDSKENADFKLAMNLYNDKLYDLAVEQFRQYINLYPNTSNGVEARFYLALTQQKLGKLEEAKLSFQNFALGYPENPKAPDAWLAVADILLTQKNEREAAVTFERVKTFHPRSKQAPSALLKASELYDRMSDASNTQRVLRMLTQEYSTPEVLPARLRLAEFSLRDGDLESARQECKKVADGTRENPLRARALTMLGSILRRQGKTAEANAALQEVISKLRSTSSYHAALLELGQLKKSLGATAEAQAAWRSVADDSAKASAQVRQDALLELAGMASGARDFVAAQTYAERASRIRASRTGEAFWRAARAAVAVQQPEKARAYFIRAAMDSAETANRANVLSDALDALMVTGEFREAVDRAAQFVNEFPQDARTPGALLKAADVWRDKLHDASKAAELYRKILAAFPASQVSDEAQFGLGVSLRRLRMFDEAIRTFEQLPVQFPSSDLTEEASDQIVLIRAFDVREENAGVEQLALLIGDVVDQKSKGDLSYRLAEIYYRQLKNYDLAAEQYRNALNSGIDPAKRPAAWMALARAFENLALRDREMGDVTSGSRAQSQAAAAYDSLLKQIPSNEFTDEAATRLFSIRAALAQNLTDVRTLTTKLVADFPNLRRKDLVFLTLANRLAEQKSYEEAALTYKLVADRYTRAETIAEAQFRFGFVLIDQGERDSAASQLKRTLEQNPNHALSARAVAELARLASLKGNGEEANAFYDKLHQKYFYTEFNDDLLRNKGDAWFAAKNYRSAISAYEQYAVQRRDAGEEELPLDIVYRMATAQNALNNRAAAKELFTEYINRENQTERAGECYLALTSIAKAENNLDAAAKFLQEAGRLSKQAGSSVAVALETADLLFNDEKYQEALTRYSELAGQTKSDSLLRHLQARAIVCYLRMDNLKEADKRFTSFVKANANAKEYVSEFEYERGRYFFRKQDFEKAKQRFNIVLSQFDSTHAAPEALFWLGRTYELDEKLPVAATMYDSVLKRFPQSSIVPRVRLSLANAYYTLELWDNAAPLFRQLIDGDAASPELTQYAMNNLIMTYKQMGQFDGAMDLTRKYIERYPNDPDLIDKRVDIGVIYQKLGYYDQSIVHLQSLLENGNSDLEAELRYYIGEDYYYKGEYQQAILEFLKVPYLVTKKGKVDWIATAYYMAGQSYEKMNKYSEANTMYKQIVERSGIDATFKSAAQKEIERVNGILSKRN